MPWLYQISNKSECWALKQEEGKNLQVIERKMLPLTVGVAILDKVKREYLRRRLEIWDTEQKIEVKRLRELEHIVKWDKYHIIKKVRQLKIEMKLKRKREGKL